MPRAKTEDAPAAPNESALREAALAFLARRSASVAEVERVLERHVAAWSRRALRAGRDEAEVEREADKSRALVGEILARFRQNGLLDEARFAESRARSLGRSGRSRRFIAAHLAARGVERETTHSVLPDDADELIAALTLARKKRLGPFAGEDGGDRDAARERSLGALARAGFSFSIAERVLRMAPEDADALLGGRDAPGW